MFCVFPIAPSSAKLLLWPTLKLHHQAQAPHFLDLLQKIKALTGIYFWWFMPRLYLQSMWKKYWRVYSHQHFSETAWLRADWQTIIGRLTSDSISLLHTNSKKEMLLPHSFIYLSNQQVNIHLVNCNKSWMNRCGQELCAISLRPFPELITIKIQ